ncbi:hypothetical protein CNH01273 [Cryptococcus deneoformans JEC21]|uniref:Ribonuclease H n=1 Tax=Cryptococcus deneoformans (strain JEC21 / ATCC MYA-565) TaxID=214684 RepID=A0A0S2M5X1_CRYD1|nr:hypothetical protein CNH01273 [Cryptococcus neoformans var. neoformans JEC21]ALO69537.1 hypothetical protein CNH01273 [Cryptococcus neoformans var. neoformans JEC21]
MPPKQGKKYAVAYGRRPGVYNTWQEAEQQVKGYPNAIHKKCKTEEEAYQWIGRAHVAAQSGNNPTPQQVYRIAAQANPQNGQSKNSHEQNGYSRYPTGSFGQRSTYPQTGYSYDRPETPTAHTAYALGAYMLPATHSQNLYTQSDPWSRRPQEYYYYIKDSDSDDSF